MYIVLRRLRYIWPCVCIYTTQFIPISTYLYILIIYYIHTILGYINSKFTPSHHGRSRETLRRDLCAEIFFTFKYVYHATFRGENKFCTRCTLYYDIYIYIYRCRWACRIIYILLLYERSVERL